MNILLAKKEGMLFRQLSDSSEFAEFSLILKRLTGLAMALNTPDVSNIQTGIPNEPGNPLCLIIRGTDEGARRCGECDRKHHAKAAANGKASLYVCHAGFYDMAIPIIVQDSHVATISSGQVLPEQPCDANFKRLTRRLRWLNVKEPKLSESLQQSSMDATRESESCHAASGDLRQTAMRQRLAHARVGGASRAR